MNNIVTLHVKGKLTIDFSSTPTPPPSTPAGATGVSSPTPPKAPANSSAPRQAAAVSGHDLAHQLAVMVDVAQEVEEYQTQLRIQRTQTYENCS